VADVHLAAFERLAAADLDSYVSIKLSAMDFDAALFAELASAAERTGRRLHVDSLAPETAEPTWRLAAGVASSAPFGMTLPSRWHRSLDDARRAVEKGYRLRVVKGHWADDHGERIDPRAGFLDVIDRLCGSNVSVGVASHDVGLLRESLRRLTVSGTPCEAELFLGMPFRGPSKVAKSYGVPVRLYVPYGDAWPGYGITDLITHPRTIWWLAQDLAFGHDKTWRSIRRSRTG
jgi:proline dehydrogenase